MYPAFSYPASSPDFHPFSPRYCTGGGGAIFGAVIYAKNITTMKHYFFFLIAWLSLSLSVAHAQHHAFSGRVTDTQRQPLVGVRVLLSRGDSLMAAGRHVSLADDFSRLYDDRGDVPPDA